MKSDKLKHQRKGNSLVGDEIQNLQSPGDHTRTNPEENPEIDSPSLVEVTGPRIRPGGDHELHHHLDRLRPDERERDHEREWTESLVVDVREAEASLSHTLHQNEDYESPISVQNILPDHLGGGGFAPSEGVGVGQKTVWGVDTNHDRRREAEEEGRNEQAFSPPTRSLQRPLAAAYKTGEIIDSSQNLNRNPADVAVHRYNGNAAHILKCGRCSHVIRCVSVAKEPNEVNSIRYLQTAHTSRLGGLVEILPNPKMNAEERELQSAQRAQPAVGILHSKSSGSPLRQYQPSFFTGMSNS